MTTIIHHHKSISLNLSLSPVQVFDGKIKLPNPRHLRKRQTKSIGALTRSYVGKIYQLIVNFPETRRQITKV